jgi:hypothetical protein
MQLQRLPAYQLADPRECPVGIEPTYLVWKTSTFAARPRAHAEGEGVEPSRLIARLFSRQLPSPVGLPFRSSCGGRNRTCNRLLNREPPYHWATPQEVRTVGFEPTLSGSRNRRIAGLSYVLKSEHPAGVEPALPAWRAGRLPLHHGCKWDPRDSNPYLAG